MSQNTDNQNKDNTARTSGGAGTGATDAGTTRDTSRAVATTTPTTSGGASGAAAQAQDLAGRAKDQAQVYGQKAADAAQQAKEYVSDKVAVVGDKLKDLQNTDVRQVAEDAKQYARQNPGQALLISAAAGFLLGILLRGSSRR